VQIRNTQTQYGIVTKSLHWLMALIIISMLCVGLYMAGLPISEQKLQLYGIHKEFGILVLMLVMFRITWRIGNIVPLLPASIPTWQKFAAHGVHWMLYGFMFALPITGWLMTSAAGLPPSFFGLFTLPSLISPNSALLNLFVDIHTWLAYGLIATFGAHVGAALKHHFINKDDVLRRML
jgi:cytochrome b561